MVLCGRNIDIKIEKPKFLQALVLGILGVIMPGILSHENFSIIESIHKSVEDADKGMLIIAALKLVLLNTVRAYPNYLSAFTLIDSIAVTIDGRRRKIIGTILGVLILPVIYFMVDKIYGIRYSSEKLTIITILYLALYSKLKFRSINSIKRILVFLFFLMSIQWLDITSIPLNIGEISYEIRQAAIFIEGTNILDLLGIMFFLIFFLFSILLMIIFTDQEKMLEISKNNQEIIKKLSEMKLKEVENRFSKEVRYLVHDLKTPLFSIKTLIELLDLQEEDEKKRKYYKRIEKSLEKSNLMVSEILKSDVKNPITTRELFDFVFSCLSTHERVKDINYKNEIINEKVRVNKVFFSRAVINLIVNAFEASNKSEIKKINVSVEKDGDFIMVKIDDFGKGIVEEEIKNIFDSGYSTKGSSGIGLNFVKKVMEEHECVFEIKKGQEIGTEVFIKIEKTV
jgi:signal transduction histidine kinase